MISAVGILVVTYIMKVQGHNPSLLAYAGNFPLWILFFFMGVYFSKQERNYNIAWPVALVVIGLVLQLAEYNFWLSRGVQALGIKISSFIFSAGVVWLVFCKRLENSYSENVCFKVINYVGGISFGVYLLHCYIVAVSYHLFKDSGWIVSWVFVLAATVLIISVLKFLIPKFASKYLGFR